MQAIETEVYRTDEFDEWLSALKDTRAAAKIAARIDRLQHGNPGDTEPVGEGVVEMRIHYGPGYRVYYVTQGRLIVVLLSGGTKGTQEADIKFAKELARQLKD